MASRGTRDHNFRLKLTQVASQLDVEKLERLKFLCTDSIPAGDREKIKTPEQLFLELEQRNEVAPNRLTFLINCLVHIGRKDLAEDLKDYERQQSEGNAGAADGSSVRLERKVKDSIQRAESFNNRGKVEFQEGRYEKACQQYTSALECLPQDQERDARAKYLCNRAACYVKLRKFIEAHEDCDSALLLNPHNAKARYRLVQSLQGEGKIADAFAEVTSLLQKDPKNSAVAQLESTLRKQVEDAKQKAMETKSQGEACFQKSDYEAAITKFSEGILMLPRLDKYAREMKHFYCLRAECYLRKNNLEAALKDCGEADRLVAEDVNVLYMKMQILDRMNRCKECFAVCTKLVEMKFKVAEVEETKKRLLPKIVGEDEESEKPEESELSQCVEVTSVKKSKKKRKGSKKKKGKEANKGTKEENRSSLTADDSLTSVNRSNTTPSLPDEGDVEIEEGAASNVVPKTEVFQGSFSGTGSAEQRDTELFTLEEDVGLLDKEAFINSGGDQETEDVSFLSKPKDKESFDKLKATVLTNLNNTFTESLSGDAYPRRILLICDRWSCWHRSVCAVNRQLSRSFARNKDVHVACLVLDATVQETIAATRDGVSLIKATPQPGICQGDEHLLHLHSDFPFKPDLLIGYGRISGTAAAIQAKRLGCKRLHIYHTLPREDEDGEETDRGLGLSVDFVAGIGPLVVEQWEAILNREVFTIIPGLPDVAPRNSIMTPQSRCLILGKMDNSSRNGLDLITAALSECRQREDYIHLTVLGTEREKVQVLKEDMKTAIRSSRVVVAVKPFDVSQEAASVEVRGVSLVLIPSPSDGFGMVALEAIAAKVPVLISSSSGIAKFLHQEFGAKFLKLLCSSRDGKDSIDAWASAIDGVLDDRQEAFSVAASLWDKWNSTFTWDLTVDRLLQHLSSSGCFSVSSPSANKQIILPSQCSVAAIRCIQWEIDLLNRRRKHVLFLSPENVKESPFIHYFAQVPWAAVLDFDVNSVKNGYLASCETFGENMGMKICRILPPSPDEDRKKFPIASLTGIPWVLLEGIPDSKRSIKGNLEWIREFFLALCKTYQVPITFTVLWKSSKETETLCKSLLRILTVVQGSPLFNQVKLVIVSTGETVSTHLEDIAEDWGVEVQTISLEDFCNALCQCVNSSPFILQNQDFSLPVADPDDPQKVTFKVLPPSSRWIDAEMEVLFQSVGSTPQFETDDACHFYRGGLISWYALQMGYAVERGNWKALKTRVNELLLRAGSVTLKMPHQRGAGGTTSARKILFDYHEKYPCVSLKSVGHAEVAQGIKVLSEFCKLPVIILVDCKQTQGDEFDVDSLFNVLSNDRIPCVILEVVHQSQKQASNSSRSSEKSEKTPPVRLADALDSSEAKGFVETYSTQRKEKLSKLRSLQHHGQREVQIPFYYALTTFEDRFTGLEPFVRDCLQGLSLTEQKILLFLAIAYHYGHNSLSANEFAGLLHAPRRDVISLEAVLPELSRELLLEEDDKWRPRHDLIAVEMLRQLITMTPRPNGSPPMHLDNWQSLLAEKALDFFGCMSENVVNDVLLSRIPDDTTHQYISFSQLISDIPFEEDAIKLFEKAISLFPYNPFFQVHLGRFYSIQKKSAGFSMAIKYTDEGICCSQSYSPLVRGQFAQMKGVVYSREVNHLVEQNADIKSVIDMADEGVKNFRRAVSIAPDFVDGYIPEVRMMCKVFEYIDRKTGNVFDYVRSSDAHPFIIDAISDTSNTLECVPDSDEYPHWRMRLACLGRRNFSPRQVEETLELLYHLRNSGRASRGSINRQIVIMRIDMCGKNSDSLSDIALELIYLLNEALKHDANIEQTMRLWVRLAPFIPVPLAESESKVFYWCSKSKSVRSYLYKFIIACLHLLEGGSSTYREVMKNAYDDLNSEVKAINRPDVGRCRHPDRPVVWLGRKGKGMGHLVYLDDKSSQLKDVRIKRFIDANYTKQLRPLTGIIVKTGPKVGTIRINGQLDVTFRADLCATPLVSSAFTNRKVQFFLAFTFFGTDAYNVRLVAE